MDGSPRLVVPGRGRRLGWAAGVWGHKAIPGPSAPCSTTPATPQAGGLAARCVRVPHQSAQHARGTGTETQPGMWVSGPLEPPAVHAVDPSFCPPQPARAHRTHTGTSSLQATPRLGEEDGGGGGEQVVPGTPRGAPEREEQEEGGGTGHPGRCAPGHPVQVPIPGAAGCGPGHLPPQNRSRAGA